MILRDICKFFESKIHHCWLLCRLEFRFDLSFVDKSSAFFLNSIVSWLLEISGSDEVRLVVRRLCF